MRVIMGVIKSKDGVYYVRKKVPPKLEVAVSTVLGVPRPKVSWLKKSLRTKDVREANIKAKPVLLEFDSILARAEGLLQEAPLQTHLSEREIDRMADYQFASMLEEDEEVRRDGTGSEELFQAIARQLQEAGAAPLPQFSLNAKPAYGLSDREMLKLREGVEGPLAKGKDALARGDISFVSDELSELLCAFRVNLDCDSRAYRRLGMAVLGSYVRALQAIESRNRGEVIESPRTIEPEHNVAMGSTLSAALDGWKKAKQPSRTVLFEFDHAVRRFIELHGDLRIVDIRRSHVRQFREGLQAIPVRRSGALLRAALPELVERAKQHPDEKKIAASTVNKLLGGVQAVALWGFDNGLTPDDVPWADPFARMRLDEEEPQREPWEVPELQLLFSSPVFSRGARPDGGRGEAAYWLPLLALFTGARQGELAPLIVGDVTRDDASGITIIAIREDEERGKRLKTASMARQSG